jgi:Outer membrane protein
LRRFLTLLLGFILFLGFPPLVWAEEPPGAPQLTLEQAVALAMDNSTTLKADLLAIDQAKEDRDAAGLAVTYTPTGRATPEAEAAFTRLLQADLTWRMAKKTYEADRDSVVMKVYQAYTGVLQACAAVDAAEKALRSADWQHRAAVAGYRVGTLSKSQMIQADASTTGAQAQLAAAEKALDDAYHKLINWLVFP